MSEKFFIKELSNGMTLLGQRMEQVSSAALTFLVRGGAAHDDERSGGTASVLCEWLFRGAGRRNTRQLNDALDSLGTHHTESVGSEYIHLGAAQLGKNLNQVWEIYRDILRRPRLEDATFEPCRALVEQDLRALEDEPANKCGVLLKEKFYPYPLGRCIYGRSDSLRGLKGEGVRRSWEMHYTPMGTILGVAGNFDWGGFCDLAERSFGDWDGSPVRDIVPHDPQRGVTHVEKPSAQVHIALACDSAIVRDKLYYPARLIETILSGGMSSRLLTEVREKRGLVYAISCRYHCLKDHAGLFTHAGTTSKRAQETLDVTIAELRRLKEGVTDAEMDTAKRQLKTAIVMHGESTTARANTLTSDWYHLKRLRTLKELSRAVDEVTKDDIMEYVGRYPLDSFTVLTIGPEPPDTSAINT